MSFMKFPKMVKCDTNREEEKNLTRGQTYIAESMCAGYYYLQDDNGEYNYYHIGKFSTVQMPDLTEKEQEIITLRF